MSDSRDLVLDFWKNKGTYIEKYGWAYSKEDIKVLLTEVKKQSALEELDLFNKLIEEKKVDRIFNNAYNITIEVVAYANLKNHIEKRKENLKEEVRN
jgi:hypothetical protein